MKLKKYAMLAAALLLAIVLTAGCAAPQPQQTPTAQTPVATPAVTTPAPTPDTTPAPKATLNIATLKGPTGMGMAKMMQANEAGETAVNYTFALAGAPDEITAKIINGEADIASVPINLAAALYNKTAGGVRILAVNTLGVLYVLENGDSIQQMADLAGKTLYATGQGATPEYILNYLLEKNGIAGKVNIEYKTDHAELATLIAAGEVDIAMLPEPNVTAAQLKNADLRIALDLTAQWDQVSGGAKLVQGCIIVRKEILESNPEAITNFLADYASSTAFTNEQPEQAAALIEQYGILPGAAVAQKALPKCNIVCLQGEEMKQNAQAMLQVLFDADPKSVGGALPDELLYYISDGKE